MAAPLIPLLLGVGLALLAGGNRSSAPTPRPTPPQPTGQPLPDNAFGPVRGSVPLQTPPQLPPPPPRLDQLARAEAVQPQYSETNIFQQSPIDRRTAATQLQEYLRTHTGGRRDRNTVRYYQGLLGIPADGLDGPITQAAIGQALGLPGFAPQFQPTPQQPQYETAKQSPGGWENYQPPQQGYYEQGKQGQQGSSGKAGW